MNDFTFTFHFHALEKAMAPHSSTLAWKIPWTEEPCRLLSMGSHRVGHDWATSLSLLIFHSLEKEMATHSSVLAWRIPGMGEPVGLPSLGSHRVGHDWSDLAAAAAVTDGAEHLFACLFVICISSLVKCLFKSFGLLKNLLFVFFLLSFVNSLYTLRTNYFPHT